MEKRIRDALRAAFDSSVAENSTLTCLGQHASSRVYWRVSLSGATTKQGENTLIAMVLDLDHQDSEEASSTQNEEEYDFIAVQKCLNSLGIRVPIIEFADHKKLGVLLLEDLGDTTLEDFLLAKPTQRIHIYETVIDLLVETQSMFEARKPEGVWSHRSFENSVLEWEMMHFYDWALETRMPKEAAKIKTALTNAFRVVVDELSSAPSTFVFRDYQSRNIMRKGNEWVVIDFQDALLGPYCYDLVALLRDSYVSVFPNELDHLIQYYASSVGNTHLPWQDVGEEKIRRLFFLQTLQRKLKDAGRFIFIRDIKKNDSFVQYFAPSLQYVSDALEELDDPQLASIDDAVRLALSKPI